jgi:hypothetical protein
VGHLDIDPRHAGGLPRRYVKTQLDPRAWFIFTRHAAAIKDAIDSPNLKNKSDKACWIAEKNGSGF